MLRRAARSSGAGPPQPSSWLGFVLGWRPPFVATSRCDASLRANTAAWSCCAGCAILWRRAASAFVSHQVRILGGLSHVARSLLGHAAPGCAILWRRAASAFVLARVCSWLASALRCAVALRRPTSAEHSCSITLRQASFPRRCIASLPGWGYSSPLAALWPQALRSSLGKTSSGPPPCVREGAAACLS
jgi:hypothetical protein